MTHEHGEDHSHEFEPGDLICFTHLDFTGLTRSGGIVVTIDNGLLTIALAHGVEVWNMRSARFVNAWRVEHTPRPMTADEALEFAPERLRQLRSQPLVILDPSDEVAGEYARLGV